MKVSKIVEALSLEILTFPDPNAEVSGGYVGDLLSWVMGRAEADQVWITIMTNINIIAVASLAGVGAVIIAEGSEVAEDVKAKAGEQGINLLRSGNSAFDVAIAVGKLLGL